MSELEGLRHISLMSNADAGRFIFITMWESASDKRQAAASGFVKAQIDRIAPLFAAPPHIDNYSVALDH